MDAIFHFQLRRDNPSHSKKQHLDNVDGNTDKKLKIWRRLERKGQILVAGMGVRGDKNTFTWAGPLPADLQEQLGIKEAA
jgi:hypothetical protein